MEYLKQFGASPSKAQRALYAQSPQWDGKKFLNLEETTMEFSWSNLPEFLRKQFFEKENREPAASLPIQAFQKEDFLQASSTSKAIWYGHSALLMKIMNYNILIDPMLGDNASPIAPFKTQRFSKESLALIEELPEIDLVLITHDHYDHLDYASIKKLKGKVKQYFVALGVGRHLVEWGIPKENIKEFDWWDAENFQEIRITFTPSRHFSGRGLTDRAKSLWGGWVFRTPEENLYFSGDGGYGKHFLEVGEKLGPFDFAWMECGQYNENWHQIHMYPEESVQAALDAKVKKAMPVHWGGFALALHSWTDPITRFVSEADKSGLKIHHPQIGELLDYTKDDRNKWWESF